MSTVDVAITSRQSMILVVALAFLCVSTLANAQCDPPPDPNKLATKCGDDEYDFSNIVRRYRQTKNKENNQTNKQKNA